MKLPTTVSVPRCFHPAEILTRANLEYYGITRIFYWKVIFVLGLLTLLEEIKAYPEEDSSGFIQLSQRFLERIISRGNAAPVLDFLLNKGVIECDFISIPRRKSYGYKYSLEYASMPFADVPLASETILNHIEGYNAIQSQLGADLTGIYGVVADDLDRFTFEDFEDSIEFENSIVRNFSIRCAERFNQGTTSKTKNSRTGRFYSTLSGLPTVVRPYLRLDNEPIAEVDIPSAQPLLLCSLLDAEDQQERNELLRFVEIVSQGFYNVLYQQAGKRCTDRKAMKRECFRRIFYGYSLRPASRLWNAFQSLFPILARKVIEHRTNNANGGDHLAIVLQKAEANLIFNDLGVVLHRSGVVFGTIHDSIVCKHTDAEFVCEQMQQAIDRAVGIRTNLTITPTCH